MHLGSDGKDSELTARGDRDRLWDQAETQEKGLQSAW